MHVTKTIDSSTTNISDVLDLNASLSTLDQQG